LQYVNTLLSNGPKVTVMYSTFLSKGPPNSLISSASFFNLGGEAFAGWLSDDETEFWALVTSFPPSWGVWSAADTALPTATALCKYSAFKGTTIETVMCKSYAFKKAYNSKCNVQVGSLRFQRDPQ